MTEQWAPLPNFLWLYVAVETVYILSVLSDTWRRWVGKWGQTTQSAGFWGGSTHIA